MFAITADAGGDAQDGAAAVAFEREGVLERVDDGLDPLAHAAQLAEPPRLAFAVGAHEVCLQAGHEVLELLAGESFVGEDRVAVEVQAAQHLGGHFALAEVGGCELEAGGVPQLL